MAQSYDAAMADFRGHDVPRVPASFSLAPGCSDPGLQERASTPKATLYVYDGRYESSLPTKEKAGTGTGRLSRCRWWEEERGDGEVGPRTASFYDVLGRQPRDLLLVDIQQGRHGTAAFQRLVYSFCAWSVEDESCLFGTESGRIWTRRQRQLGHHTV